MKLKDSLIVYNVGTPHIAVGLRADDYFRARTRHLRRNLGGGFSETQTMNDAEASLQATADFIAVVGRDGVPVAEALREFMKIDEFRAVVAEDMIPAG